MSAFSAFILLAAVSTGPAAEYPKPSTAPATQPVLVETPKRPDRLALFNAKGEIVAHCDKKDESFGNCKLEPGITLDDVMNAWVHAYEDLQKR